MSRIVGIDLGTTNSVLAAVDSGFPFVVPNPDGSRTTPSVVHFPGPSASPLVGQAANRVRTLHPESTVYSIKRFMGRRAREIAREEMLVTYPLQAGEQGGVSLAIHDRVYSPEEISAEILKVLRHHAEAHLQEEIRRAVITVPAYFNDAQRNATKQAGELAGWTVERIINEPTAAALAYGLDKLAEKSRIAVYDLGGGTFDLTILELNEGTFQVLATNGNTRLGGDDIDSRLVAFLQEKIGAAGGPDLSQDPGSLARIREAAEAAKIQLSSQTEAQIALPFLAGSFSFDYWLTREELDGLARETVERTRTHCLRSLADAKLQPQDLDQVVLVGGQTRMPLVRQFVSDLFQCSEFEAVTGTVRVGDAFHKRQGPMLNTSQNPDEAVALGAAIQAEILAGGFKNMLLLDVTPLSLGIETFGGLMNVIIPRNSTIPTKAGEAFTTAADNQTSMMIHVLQGEREKAADNWSLGKFTIEFQPAPRGVARVGVQFQIDANGILQVLARDIHTGREKVVDIQSAVDVEDSDVQRMVEESVEHAFDDLRSRQWVEAKLRAEETAQATRSALDELAHEIEPDYLEEIRQALRALENHMAKDKDGAQITDADVRTLKESAAQLDQVTKPLADHLMDRAMEAMLKQRGITST